MGPQAGNAASGRSILLERGSASEYSPLKQQGGLSLGEARRSNLAQEHFLRRGNRRVTSDATDDLIQANLVSVYGR